jgi:hypothetical protein
VFYVSGSEVIGVGEHKLHARVLSLLGSCPAESHLIIGNDADLSSRPRQPWCRSARRYCLHAAACSLAAALPQTELTASTS